MTKLRLRGRKKIQPATRDEKVPYFRNSSFLIIATCSVAIGRRRNFDAGREMQAHQSTAFSADEDSRRRGIRLRHAIAIDRRIRARAAVRRGLGGRTRRSRRGHEDELLRTRPPEIHAVQFQSAAELLTTSRPAILIAVRIDDRDASTCGNRLCCRDAESDSRDRQKHQFSKFVH